VDNESVALGLYYKYKALICYGKVYRATFILSAILGMTSGCDNYLSFPKISNNIDVA